MIRVINLRTQSKVDTTAKTIKDVKLLLSCFYGEGNIIITQDEGTFEVFHLEEDKPFLMFWRVI